MRRSEIDSPTEDMVSREFQNPGQCPTGVFSKALDDQEKTCLTLERIFHCRACKAAERVDQDVYSGYVDERVVFAEKTNHSLAHIKTLTQVNQQAAIKKDQWEHELAAGIQAVIAKYKNCCGWCLAKDGSCAQHRQNECPHLTYKCFKCKGKHLRINFSDDFLMC